MTLKAIDFEAQEGEFICIIGDTGAGKSSLLNAVIGDMIYVPEAEIAAFGGLDKEGDKESFETLKNKVLGPDFSVTEKPITVNGSLGFVEQKSWI
mmetsp:Transcript_10702/g.13326  ORF Transcript_10702/g.13326 Transcript_10702/m.13326 type:complete len:95 (-) Transcript_10702:2822-3106(-)